MKKYELIGKDEVKEAINELEEYINYYPNYFWCGEDIDGGVRGGAFDSYLEPDEDIYVTRYQSLDDYVKDSGYDSFEEMVEDEAVNNEVVEAIEKRGEYLEVIEPDSGNSYECENIDDVIFWVEHLLAGDKKIKIYTKENALDYLKDAIKTGITNDDKILTKFVLDILPSFYKRGANNET